MPTARWNSRPPRFVYDADEGRLLRFAPMQPSGSARRAETLDVSVTGLSFALASNAGGVDAPDEGDVIKVEFTPPGRDPIACFATVIRVDRIERWDPERGDVVRTKVAVRFRNLPRAHERSLKLALDPLIGAVEEDDSMPFAREQVREIAVFAAALVALAMALAALAAPYSWQFLGGRRAGAEIERALSVQ